MAIFDRMSVRQRLATGFGAVVVILFLVGVLAWFEAGKINRSADNIARVSMPKSAEVTSMYDAYFQLRIKARNAVILDEAGALTVPLLVVRKIGFQCDFKRLHFGPCFFHQNPHGFLWIVLKGQCHHPILYRNSRIESNPYSSRQILVFR